ncbi:MAG: cytochrome c peroxidase [Pseudomonadota bacterium]
MRVVLLATLLVILPACERGEPVFSASEQQVLASLTLASLSSPPADPSNRVSGEPLAIQLGEQLFFDVRLSGAGDQSCASCHQPDQHFTDRRPKGHGVRPLHRNTPTLVGVAWQTWFYWDGRRDSLWSQAIVPIEAPDEMAGSRLGAARLIAHEPSYRAPYESLFGPLPDFLTEPSLPDHAGAYAFEDAQAAWWRLNPARRETINTVFANVGKLIAAYEATLEPVAAPFDHAMALISIEPRSTPDDLAVSISDDAIAGARLFADAGRTRCLQCHSGPLMTNGGFHNVGSGTLAGTDPDFGRLFGLQAVRLDPFNCLGPYSDAPPEACSALRFMAPDQHGESAGAFKVPTLRNVGDTAPYFHDGRFASLREVVEHYVSPPEPLSDHELQPLDLNDREIDQLVAFLEALTAVHEPNLSPRAAAR